MKKSPWLVVYLTAGLILFLLGLQMMAVDTYVLTPEATKLLSRWTGPSDGTPRRALRDALVDAASPHHRLTPPTWLRFALLSVGGVCTAHAGMLLWKK